MSKRCPRCDSPSPERHPAVQFEGEVETCTHKHSPLPEAPAQDTRTAPVYVTMTLAGDGLGNAVISPVEPDGMPYFTLIGAGDVAWQNAIAAKFVAGFNALSACEPVSDKRGAA